MVFGDIICVVIGEGLIYCILSRGLFVVMFILRFEEINELMDCYCDYLVFLLLMVSYYRL